MNLLRGACGELGPQEWAPGVLCNPAVTHTVVSGCILNTFLWMKVLNHFSASQRNRIDCRKNPDVKQNKTNPNVEWEGKDEQRRHSYERQTVPLAKKDKENWVRVQLARRERAWRGGRWGRAVGFVGKEKLVKGRVRILRGWVGVVVVWQPWFQGYRSYNAVGWGILGSWGTEARECRLLSFKTMAMEGKTIN